MLCSNKAAIAIFTDLALHLAFVFQVLALGMLNARKIPVLMPMKLSLVWKKRQKMRHDPHSQMPSMMFWIMPAYMKMSAS